MVKTLGKRDGAFYEILLVQYDFFIAEPIANVNFCATYVNMKYLHT